MIKIKTSFSNIKLNSKPLPKDVAKISNSISTQEVTIEEFIDKVEQGYTFCPSVFSNKRTNQNFISTQVFALDFDDNQNPIEKVNLFKDYGIEPNFVYYTFSHKERFNKFRIVFFVDTIITDRKTRDKIQKALMLIAKDSDAACKDAARMFYPTNREAYYKNTTINQYIDILPAIDSYLNACVSEPTKRQNIKSFKKGYCLYNIDKEYQKMKENENIDLVQRYKFDEAIKESKVLEGFYNGTLHLKYKQLLVLITNMSYIKGGIKWTKDAMIRKGTYKKEDFELLSICSRYSHYKPANIDEFDSALVGTHRNLLSLDNRNKKGVEIIKPMEKEDVEHIAMKAKEFMHYRFNADSIFNFGIIKKDSNLDKQFVVLNADTGIGKTALTIDYAENCLIAFPSHKLKDEVAQRMRREGLDFEVTPEQPIFQDKELKGRYNFYLNIGDSDKANKIIKDLIKQHKKNPTEDTRIAVEYQTELDICYNTHKTVLTTHKRALLSHQSFNKKHIVFDEDIMKELMPITEFKSSDIENLINEIKFGKYTNYQRKQLQIDLRNVTDYLSKLPTAIVKSTEKIVYSNQNLFLDAIVNLKGGENLAKALRSDYLLRYVDTDDVQRFYAVNKVNIDTNSKITVMSATADKHIYKKLFVGQDYYYKSLGVAKNKKPIVQYTGKQFSRTQMKNQEIPDIDKDAIVITYKEHKKLFKNADQLVHFGNSTGYDHLKGEDIAVVGTPIPSPIVVALYAKVLDIDYKTLEKEYRTVVNDNFRYSNFTYIDDDLARLDAVLTTSELRQAIGRSRTTRTDGKVELYSSIPVASADIFVIDYKQKQY